MTLLDVNIVVVALPVDRQEHRRASRPSCNGSISGYALGFGLVPIIAGRLGDDRGRKQMLLIGTAGFIVTSAVIGFAPNPHVLMVARFVQGLAGGLLNPQVSGFVQNLFPRRERPARVRADRGLIGIVARPGRSSAG